MSSTNASHIAEIIQGKAYVAERLNPTPGTSPFYPVLSDVLLAVRPFATDESIRILDFGCGGSPYRALFPNADYRRADFEHADDLDYVIDQTSRVPEDDQSFDLILSTQVLEHVADPTVYLQECVRLLRPKGRLVCTTHGTYEDHGCPYDYQRWTAYGLQRDLSAAGLVIEHAAKLTTGPRAMLFLLERGWSRPSRPGLIRFLFRSLQILLRTARPYLQRLSDRQLAAHRVVVHDLDQHPFYAGLLVVGRKP